LPNRNYPRSMLSKMSGHSFDTHGQLPEIEPLI
jgi:hypothetical protein